MSLVPYTIPRRAVAGRAISSVGRDRSGIMAAMAIYQVQPDDFAGWSSAGRSFGLCGLVAGGIAIACWATLHRPAFSPTFGHGSLLPSDQLFLSALVWIGGGVFAIMALCVFGSVARSGKARGTVVVTDMGVERQIDGRSRNLAWPEIAGFVVNPMGGVTLLPREGRVRLEIPNTLDDYRGFIAEIKARGVHSLPTSRLKQKMTWPQHLLLFLSTLCFANARDPHTSHTVRLVSLGIVVAGWIWLMIREEESLEASWSRWAGRLAFVGLLTWLLYRMSHTW